tara:strand:- start:454 stop:939 length:486 start_codon:yes stop_codon:yes gene_type:complete
MQTERFDPNPHTGEPMYYKDNPEAVKRRDALRMYVNGKEISKKHPLHKPGRYKSFDDVWSHNQIDKTDEGEVYVITNPAWPDWVKVGKAVSTEDRLNGYQTSSPYRDYQVVTTITVHNRHEEERRMHRMVGERATQRIGEWFKIELDVVKAIFSAFKPQSM